MAPQLEATGWSSGQLASHLLNLGLMCRTKYCTYLHGTPVYSLVIMLHALTSAVTQVKYQAFARKAAYKILTIPGLQDGSYHNVI
jgi:hypothetical protein